MECVGRLQNDLTACTCASPHVPWTFRGKDEDGNDMDTCHVYSNLGIVTCGSRFMFHFASAVPGFHFLQSVSDVAICSMINEQLHFYYVVEFLSPHTDDDDMEFIVPRLSIDATISRIARWWRHMQRRSRSLAVMMATQKRLGKYTRLAELDDECLRLICSFS